MKLALITILAVALAACTTAPATPFKTGETVKTPYGCEKAKKEGRDVEC